MKNYEGDGMRDARCGTAMQGTVRKKLGSRISHLARFDL